MRWMVVSLPLFHRHTNISSITAAIWLLRAAARYAIESSAGETSTHSGCNAASISSKIYQITGNHNAREPQRAPAASTASGMTTRAASTNKHGRPRHHYGFMCQPSIQAFALCAVSCGTYTLYCTIYFSIPSATMETLSCNLSKPAAVYRILLSAAGAAEPFCLRIFLESNTFLRMMRAPTI